MIRKSRVVKVLDVFCGVGGLSWGFKELGFDVVGGIDVSREFLKVFSTIHPNATILETDIRTVKNEELEKIFGEVDVIIGGPPCQAFSTAGKRALDDERASLVKEFLRVVKVIKPKVVVFENVKGFTSFAKGLLLKEFLAELYDLGYKLTYDVVSATEYAVPQIRERFILIGTLKGTPYLARKLAKKVWTVREALSDLPEVTAGEKRESYVSEPQNELQKFYRRKNPHKLSLHVAKTYGQKLLELMSYLPEGVSAHEIIETLPPHLRPTSGHKNTYARMRFDQPSPTITRNFQVVSSHRCIHPKRDRGLTPREAARLQSFPDDYPLELLSGSHLSLAIGNAVPPLMSLAIAWSIGLTLNYDLEIPREVKELWKSLENLEKLRSLTTTTNVRWQIELF